VIRKIHAQAASDERTPLSVDAIDRSLVKQDFEPHGGVRRTLVTSKRPGMKSPRQRSSKRRRVRLREPSFTKNLRHKILAVSLAFERSARLLTEITYRQTIMRCRREGRELKRGLRAEHRFYWRILVRRAFADAAAGHVSRRRRRLRRLATLLKQDADRIRRERHALLSAVGDRR
jgi:hypothetical protein